MYALGMSQPQCYRYTIHYTLCTKPKQSHTVHLHIEISTHVCMYAAKSWNDSSFHVYIRVKSVSYLRK